MKTYPISQRVMAGLALAAFVLTGGIVPFAPAAWAAPPGFNQATLKAKQPREATTRGGLEEALAPAAGREEGLDELLKRAASGPTNARIRAIKALGHFFDGITIQWTDVLSFTEAPGKGHLPITRVLPDLTPVTAIGAVAVFKSGSIGSGNKELIDLASASHMRPAAEQVFRLARRNWQNLSGEGLRDGVSERAQIPPMSQPIIFSPGWHTAYTANDPVDATTRTSKGQDGGVSVFMTTPDFGPVFPDELRVENVIYAGQKAEFSLRHDSYDVIFQRIAAANDRRIEDYEVWVLNRPHHQAIGEAARRVGATVRLYQDGTVQPTLYLAAFPQKPIIVAGRVGATEGKMVAAPLRNVEYADGGRVWMRSRLISENSGFEVEERRAADGVVYYEPKADAQGKKITSTSLVNGPKLSLKDLRALRDAGYTDEQIEQIKDGSLEYELEDLAPAAGDLFLSYITDPMTDINHHPLYDWGTDVRGVHLVDGNVVVDTLEFTADGARIARHRYPEATTDAIAAHLQEQERVVNRLRALATKDADTRIQAAAREGLVAYLPHALSRDLQHQAGLGIAGLAGLEEGIRTYGSVAEAQAAYPALQIPEGAERAAVVALDVPRFFNNARTLPGFEKVQVLLAEGRRIPGFEQIVAAPIRGMFPMSGIVLMDDKAFQRRGDWPRGLAAVNVLDPAITSFAEMLRVALRQLLPDQPIEGELRLSVQDNTVFIFV